MEKFNLRRSSADKWRDVLLARDVKPEFADCWSGLVRANAPIAMSGSLPERHGLARSKFGGLPDLAHDSDWPERIGRRLDFLAQINLGDVSGLDLDLPLPASGLLQFFYDAEHQPWGFDPQDADGFQVRYVENIDTLDRPEDMRQGKRPAIGIEFSQSSSLPDWEWFRDYALEQKLFTPNEVNESFDKLEDGDLLYEMANAGNCLGGWPSQVQGAMELECQLVSNGVYCGSAHGYQLPKAKELAPGAADWRLLMQLVSMEEDLGWTWGDFGSLYFWCREQDIAERRFDRSWVILQCG